MDSQAAARRQKLEEIWRSKLEEAELRYKAATNEYGKLLEKTPDGLLQQPNGALVRARQAQTEALVEYNRVLRVFTDLIVSGKQPEEQSGART